MNALADVAAARLHRWTRALMRSENFSSALRMKKPLS